MVDLNSLLKENASATQPSFVPRGGGMDMGSYAMTQGPGSMMGFGGMDNGMGIDTNMMGMIAPNHDAIIGGGFAGFPDGIGGNGGGGGGAMSGIMDTINSSYGEMEGAMQGAFDTIKQSLSNNYTSQEVLVPNNGGGEMAHTPPGGIGNAQMPPMMRPGPDMNSIFQQGLPNLQQAGPGFDLMQYQGNENDFFGPQPAITFVNNQEQGGPALPNYNGNQFEGGPAPMEINQDNNQQQISQQQQIDDMFAGMSGQFNGPQ